ncbi:hypothetical protein HZC53_04855 [Candidatus Uhrbacteria bacterium]|nr:hypothetical protein [Candidatus Uhrbacteria bacterium]
MTKKSGFKKVNGAKIDDLMGAPSRTYRKATKRAKRIARQRLKRETEHEIRESD